MADSKPEDKSSNPPIKSGLKREVKAKQKQNSLKRLGFQMSSDEDDSDEYNDMVKNNTYEKLVSEMKFICDCTIDQINDVSNQNKLLEIRTFFEIRHDKVIEMTKSNLNLLVDFVVKIIINSHLLKHGAVNHICSIFNRIIK